MTEEQWLAATDPGPMLDFLRDHCGGSDRKLRLFAVACCRRVWSFLTHNHRRAAVEAAEGFADGVVSRRELEKASARAAGATPSGSARMAVRASRVRLGDLAAETAHSVGPNLAAALLRDVFDNPFRPASIPPAVLAWDGCIVPKLAAAIYNDRTFDRLPVLADALEDACCTNADLLAHCRSGGEHARGCWAVDRILGKT